MQPDCHLTVLRNEHRRGWRVRTKFSMPTLAQVSDFFAFFEDGQPAGNALGHLPPRTSPFHPKSLSPYRDERGVYAVSHPWIRELRLGVAGSKLGDAELNLHFFVPLSGETMRTACWAVGIFVSCSATAQQPPAAPVQAAGRPVAEWIADLKSDDVLVREEALLVLGGLGPRAKEALPALTALLKDPAPTVRTKAALAAWQIDRGVKEAVPILLETLQRGTRGQRGQVLALIGQLAEGEPDVLVALLKMAHDPDKELSAKARDAANKLGARALPALTKLAESPDGNVRKQAIVQIGRCGAAGQSAAGVLTARLKDEDWETRFLAAQALWSVERRTADVVPILVQAAEKPDVIARRTAFT